MKRCGPRAAVLALALALGSPLHAGRGPEVRRQAFEWLNEGVAALEHGDYREAVAKLERCAGVWLNSFRAYYYLGRAYLAARRPADALEALQVALDLEPTHLGAHVALGDAQLALGDPEEARAAYYRALDLRAEFAPALDGIARTYHSQGDPEQAVRFFERAIASDRSFGAAYTHLAALHLEQERVGEAVRVLQQAIAVRPDFAPAYDRLALAYIRLGLENEAVAAVRRAIALEPRAPDHLVTLGQVLTNLSRFAGARQALERALELDPGMTAALEALAELERRSGDFEAAQAALVRALQEPSLDPLTRQRLERTRDRWSEQARAAAELQARAASGSAEAETLAELAGALAARGAWAQAAQLLQGAPARPEDLPWLAYFQLRAGRCAEAEALYRALLEQQAPPSPELWLNLGVALACMGDDAGAAEAYERARALGPGLRVARLYLANALLRTGRVEEALTHYLGFLEEEPRGTRAELVRRILRRLAPERLPEDREAPARGAPPREPTR